MVWKKDNTIIIKSLYSAISLFTVFIFILSIATSAHAIRNKKISDAMWSVSNQNKKEIVPSYTGGDSPFPIVKIKKKKVRLKVKGSKSIAVKRKKTVFRGNSNKKTKSQEAKIAEIMTKIQEVIKDKQAYNPDIEEISIDGFINSTFGAKVLINNKWFTVGENISVRMMQTEDLNVLIGQLAEIDSKLSEIVSNDLRSKMKKNEASVLILTKITNDFIEVKDKSGTEHIISFIINSL